MKNCVTWSLLLKLTGHWQYNDEIAFEEVKGQCLHKTITSICK